MKFQDNHMQMFVNVKLDEDKTLSGILGPLLGQLTNDLKKQEPFNQKKDVRLTVHQVVPEKDSVYTIICNVYEEE